MYPASVEHLVVCSSDVVETLLPGLAGALLAFMLGVVREWWRNEQERRGLLRILLGEIEHNDEVVRTIARRKGEQAVDWLVTPDLQSLKVETWRDLRESRHADARCADASVERLLFADPYSPQCVVGEFCEVHIQDPAYPRSYRARKSRLHRSQVWQSTLHLVVLNKDAAG